MQSTFRSASSIFVAALATILEVMPVLFPATHIFSISRTRMLAFVKELPSCAGAPYSALLAVPATDLILKAVCTEPDYLDQWA